MAELRFKIKSFFLDIESKNDRLFRLINSQLENNLQIYKSAQISTIAYTNRTLGFDVNHTFYDPNDLSSDILCRDFFSNLRFMIIFADRIP